MSHSDINFPSIHDAYTYVYDWEKNNETEMYELRKRKYNMALGLRKRKYETEETITEKEYFRRKLKGEIEE